MKTVAVLAAFAALATAVPALPGYGYERYRPAHYGLPAQYRREKKSPQDLAVEASPAVETLPSLDAAIAIDVPHSELEITPDMSARTIGLKKPIIVKKKFGYHLYRDSDEEMAQADPQEKCTKEVKVKLCDAEHLVAKSSDQMRSATENSSGQLSDNDMKHSIKLAKEAVENLQKMTQFQNAELGPDAELHGDIEVARQALEHIQQNFGNLESMNLQATTLSDAEALQNAHLKLAQTGGERMAQWKEAIENIQKNAEIAKNIEDSFKSESHSKVPLEESTKKMKSSEDVPTTANHNEASIKIKSSNENEAKHDAPLKKNAEHENLHEMEASASEQHEVKSTLHDKPVSAKKATPTFDDVKVDHKGLEKDVIDSSKQGKSNEHEPSLQAAAMPVMEKSSLHEESAKDTQTEDKTKNMDKAEQLKASEKKEDVIDLAPAQSATVMKSVAPPALDIHRSANSWANNAERQTAQEKGAWKETHDMKMKSIENVPVTNEKKIESAPLIEQGKSADLDTTSLMKSAEMNQNQEKLHKDETPFLGKEAHEMVKSTENKEFLNEHVVNVEHSFSPLRSANLVSQQGSIHSSNKQQFETQGKNWHEDKMTGKSGEMFHSNAEFGRDAHHHHMSGHQPHAFASSSSHANGFGRGNPGHFVPGHQHDHRLHDNNRFHDQQVFHHGKAAEADSMVQATSQINVNDISGKAATGAARGAYGPGGYGAGGAGALSLGAGAASGPGAVGVFPGANVGGCAIPLLLSCSPSVVHGSLAKTSYGSHAYRAGEEINGRFHNKRDTKKTNDISTSKVKRNHNKVIQKVPSDKKL